MASRGRLAGFVGLFAVSLLGQVRSLSAENISVPAERSKVPHGTAELIAKVRSVHPGSAFEAGVYFQLEPGWHVYWRNPGDSGQPPRLKWALPAGWTAGSFDWPVPKRLPLGTLLDYGYEGNVLLPFTITPSASTASASGAVVSEQVLKADLRVLVCREVCIPGKASLSLTLPVTTSSAVPDAAHSGMFDAAAKARPLTPPAGLRIAAKQSPASLFLTVSGIPQEAKLSFVPNEPNVIENGAAQELSATGGAVQIRLKRAADSAAVPSPLQGLLFVNDKGAEKAYSIAAPIDGQAVAGPDKSLAPSATRATALPAPQGLLTILALAFGGGLVLNLMPCVFPVLSIKILGLLAHSAGERKTIRLNAGFYTAGIVLSFWLLVAFLLALRTAGRSLGWGFQLQSPGFVAFLICLLFMLGLSLIGAFEIGASIMNFGSGLTHGDSYRSSFFTGILAVVVATPCTAPLMGVAVGFALSQPAVVCLLVFTLIAFGLASPFLVLSIFPALSSLLPRPGRWMEVLKQAMAFPIFATVVWLLWVIGQQVDITQLCLLLLTLLALGFAAWLLGRWPQSVTAMVVAILFAVSTVGYSCATLTASPQIGTSALNGPLQWEAFTPEKLAAYRAAGRPVLLDFTAAWCLTCQVNDRVLFHSNAVADRLNRSKIALLRADWTSYDPAITETLAGYGRSSIPLYVIYAAQPAAGPVLLPDGVLASSTLFTALDRLSL